MKKILTGKKGNDLRSILFGLAIANLAFVIPTFFAAAVFYGAQWKPGLAAWVPQALSKAFAGGDLVFILSDNRVSGVLFGILVGALGAVVLRRVWINLVFCSLGLVSGVLAVNVGWGIWMGTLLGFWLHQVIRFRKIQLKQQFDPGARSVARSTVRSALKWRVMVVVVTILLVFMFSDFLAIFIRTFEVAESTRENRFLQWIMAGALTLAIDTVLAAVFFHFYSVFYSQSSIRD